MGYKKCKYLFVFIATPPVSYGAKYNYFCCIAEYFVYFRRNYSINVLYFSAEDAYVPSNSSRVSCSSTLR